MELKLRKYDDIYIVDVSGDMDLYNASGLKNLFVKMIDKKIIRIIINLDKVEYIDSSGVGVLLNLYASAKQKGLVFFLTNIHGTVSKVLTLTKLNGFFPFAATVEDAVRRIRTSD